MVFLLLPWLRINGRQALLLDIVQRRFSIFGITFWAHDAPMLVFVIGGAALSLGLVTAIWGRAWCGWACPQSVFIESLFRTIERFVEGDHLAQRRLDLEAWSADKFFKKGVKWGLFAAVTLIVTHSFIAVFVGTEELSKMIRRPPMESPISFFVMIGISAAILFDFGWFREQFCTVLCPYGRFQSVLMDDHSLLVFYDAKRGEPRKGSEPLSGPKGDCVNCYRCVQVCPTGIDIRRGAQLECVGCTACIDACDDVMARLHKPSGLIRYDSAVGLQGSKPKIIRSRTVAYAVLLIGVAAGLAISLATRRPIEATFVRAVDTPYQEIKSSSGGAEIVNRFKVDLSNQSFDDVDLDLAPTPEFSTKGVQFISAGGPLHLDAGKKAATEFFVRFPKPMLSMGHALIRLDVRSNRSGRILTEELNLVGPYF